MATEGESCEPVVVPPADVLEGLEAVRRSGANMVERAHVLVLAKRMGYRQTVRWVEEHSEEYARGCFHGFVASESPTLNRGRKESSTALRECRSILSTATPSLRRDGTFRASWTTRAVVDAGAYNLGSWQTRAFE